MNGFDLRKKRIEAGIQQKDLAVECGVSAPRLWYVETSFQITDAWAKKYMAALTKLIERKGE